MWQTFETCYFYEPEPKSYESMKGKDGGYKIFLFDLDGTLTTVANGKKFSDTADNWVYLGPVIEKFRKLRKRNWLVAIVSNQSRFNQILKDKFEDIRSNLEGQLGWSPFIFVATKKDDFRKPETKMISLLLGLLDIESEQVEEMRMCGDAVDPKDHYPANRWSDSDRKLAENLGIDFIAANDYFGHAKITSREHQELVVLMGNPGSGKSTTATSLAATGYVIAEQDTLKTIPAMTKFLKAQLKAGHSVVVDATNPSKEKRTRWIQLAAELQIPSRILWHIRDGRPFNELREKPVPAIVYNVYSKNFEWPTEDEAEVEIIY
jgi:bifunctional polynucleotide phosphatase/kinase